MTFSLLNIFLGLEKMLFFNRLWCEKHGIQIDPKLIDALFIKHGFGDFSKNTSGSWLYVSLSF